MAETGCFVLPNFKLLNFFFLPSSRYFCSFSENESSALVKRMNCTSSHSNFNCLTAVSLASVGMGISSL